MELDRGVKVWLTGERSLEDTGKFQLLLCKMENDNESAKMSGTGTGKSMKHKENWKTREKPKKLGRKPGNPSPFHRNR